MELWTQWLQAVRCLRPACSRSLTFVWMTLVLISLCCRSDNLGVTSFVRVLNLRGDAYHRLLHLFHSKALDLDVLTSCWVRLCLVLFRPFQLGTRLVCLADGIKAPKEGKRMPAVKLLHQESQNNTKPEYVMGHSFQALSLLVHSAGGQVAAVPLTVMPAAMTTASKATDTACRASVRMLIWTDMAPSVAKVTATAAAATKGMNMEDSFGLVVVGRKRRRLEIVLRASLEVKWRGSSIGARILERQGA